MRRDGIEVLARWREAGAWWEGECPTEWVQYRDKNGVKRERSRPLRAIELPSRQREDEGNHREDISLRPRKTRDEKVALACGHIELPPPVLLRANNSPRYVPLHVYSGYSFGRSTLFAKELPRRAATLGIEAMAITDRFSLAGAVEFALEAQACGVKPLIGATVEMEEGGDLVLIARDRHGYQSLSELITACHLGEERLFPLCTRERLTTFSRGLLCLTGGDQGRLNRLLAQRDEAVAAEWVEFLMATYGKTNVFLEVERCYLPWEKRVNERLDQLSSQYGLTPVAGGLVTHADAANFPAQDILVCADTLCQVDEIIGRKPGRGASQTPVSPRPERALNGERMLRSPHDMASLFRDRPDLLHNSRMVADRCDPFVLPTRTRLPQIFDDPHGALHELVYTGALTRHRKLTPGLKRRLDWEIERIYRLNFADHFLIMWDTCRWATEQNILLSGRGSVVDSAVAYCLGISRIDAYEHDLHFDRFLPEDGTKRPDIDIDFEAKRRDDVRNYLTTKYGNDRVATVAAFGAFCTRGIVREVGKALGLSQTAIGFLAKRLHGGVAPDQLESALDKRPELRDSPISKERLKWLFRLAVDLLDLPRNARAHSSGVVISDEPLSRTVPVMWSASDQELSGQTQNLKILQWDKRSAKHYFDKFDILCLRGQDVLSGVQARVRQTDLDFGVEKIKLDDDETYRTMRAGELIGIPQSASPAMRQAHMRIKTRNLHDASLVQAGIRPGVGGAVKMNELIARRHGLKPYRFEHPLLEKILGLTYGIVVFQEQIDQLLQEFAGYGSGEAEDIRDEIHKRRREDYGQTIRDEVICRIQSKGFDPTLAEHVFQLIAGFKGYGFAQGHALAFAEISVRSIYCQQNYPAEYFSSLLDAQPAGYYGPCTLANEARTRGIQIIAPCVNKSQLTFSVEDVRSTMDPQIVIPNAGIRVGLNQISSVSSNLKQKIVSERNGGYTSLIDFAMRCQPSRDEWEQLVQAGALDDLHPHRRALLWAIPSLVSVAKANPSDALEVLDPNLRIDLPDFSVAEKAIRSRRALDLDVDEHLMAYEREHVSARGGITARQAQTLAHRQRAVVVGNPIRLRFPPTPSGRRVVFFDLEDESGLLNVTCFDDTYQRDGHAIVCSPYVTVIGHAQWRDGHMAFLAKRVFPYFPQITKLVQHSDLPVAKADFLVG